MNTALLIIDMQVTLFRKATPRFDSEAVIQRINALADTVRSVGGTVIFIQHEGPGLEPGSEGWEILPSLVHASEDLTISKQACDAFYETNLADSLKQWGITKLIITGCATDFCVDTTIRAAASRDYEVIVVEDGHTTTDRPHLKAEAIIQHHNWIWKNLILPRSQVEVLPGAMVIKRLQSKEIS
jgi:nicotinamidase-related amidase